MIRIRIQGAVGFEQELRRAEADLRQELHRATQRALPLLRDALRPRLPRRTGKLAAGLRISSRERKNGALGRVANTQFYAPMVLFGTVRRQTRQGWNRGQVRSRRVVEGAVAAARGRVEAEYEAAVQRVLDRL
ncbi:MAG TPA: HK97 gp10 family phage protein [Anaerolineae bacterium]|nr:HK97 gp10 family phage protein [Anaerolineae bacterium]